MDIMELYMMGVGFICVILVGFITLSFAPRVLRSNQGSSVVASAGYKFHWRS